MTYANREIESEAEEKHEFAAECKTQHQGRGDDDIVMRGAATRSLDRVEPLPTTPRLSLSRTQLKLRLRGFFSEDLHRAGGQWKRRELKPRKCSVAEFPIETTVKT